MSINMKYSVITASVGNLGDRFNLDGYKSDIGLEEKLKRAEKIEGLEGIELCYGPGTDEGDGKQVRKLLDTYGLEGPVVNAPVISEQIWRYGSLSSLDDSVRSKAVGAIKDTAAFASAAGASMVNMWLGQDGFDYPFQTDYTKQWEHLVDSCRQIADYAKSMKFSLEFKPREPRNRALINNVSTTLLMLKEIDRENFGLTIDNGHILQNGENMAQAVELAARQGKLFNLHLNDNYAAWDDDMIVGSVHLMEYLELFYVLHKIDYNGWCAIDIFPFREDAFRATEESIRYLQLYDRWIESVGFERLTGLIEKGDVTEVMKTVRETLFA